MRRKYQRKFNKLMRELNKSIANDNLWQGRFAFKQINANFTKFKDNSGGILFVQVRGYDKETGYYKDGYVEYAPYSCLAAYHLWRFANDFIVNDSGVWKEKPMVLKDYTKVVPKWD